MKISMMTYTIARALSKGESFDVKALCEFTIKLKIDAIDWVTTYGYDPHEIRKITDNFGLKNICHTFSCDLNFPSSAERSSGRNTFEKGIETALVLGADKVMLPVPGKKHFTREQSFRNVITGLKEVISFADKAGVTVTIENFPNYLSPFITSSDVNRAVGEIPQLRITFDNGNVTTGGESAREGFLNSAPYIIHAHFKDFAICAENSPGAIRCLDGKFRRPVLVGDGNVDQVETIKIMQESGYKGYINFEYEGTEYTPRDATIEGIRRMREWID